MRTDRAMLALTAAGLLWGTTVPLTKVALDGWGPAWLTVARFGLAALPLAWFARRGLRAAATPAIAGWGVVGYGASIVLQNAGIARTSVSHAALLLGALPVLVALAAAGLGRGRVSRAAWSGFALALCGAGFLGTRGDGTATLLGDALVFASLVLAAGFIVAQPGRLTGRDPVAVTAVQLAAAAISTVPAALVLDGTPGLAGEPTTAVAMVALTVGGTLLPFTLFTWAQARVSPAIAGAFLNLEPVVGAILGVVAFGDPVGRTQAAGGMAIVAGIALTTVAPYRIRLRTASASRSAAPEPQRRKSDGSVSSSSASNGAPSGPGMRSTRAYTSRSGPPGTAASAASATASSAVDGSRGLMSSS
jgi:drug/metabolite transporter (DMT)-like permease